MIQRILSVCLNAKWSVPAIIAGVSGIELIVANRKYGIFTGGFGQSSAVTTPYELSLFALGFISAQLASGVLAWKVASWIAGEAKPKNTVIHFAFLYGGPSLAALNIQYQLHSYFSDAVSFHLLRQLGGGSASDALLFAKNEIALGLLGSGAVAVLWFALARMAGSLETQSSHTTTQAPRWRSVGLVWLVFIGCAAVLPMIGNESQKALNRTLAWRTVSTSLSAMTDFDRDGFGVVGGNKVDAHPFDPSRHPMALDIPGNGIDEDGYFGDLSLVRVPQPMPETLIAKKRPHVVFVIFESARFDTVGKRINGQVVAPNLEALANQGAAISPAYSHVAFTTASLKSMFSGALVPDKAGPSLFRELHKSGYEISVFSGQPEDFGDIAQTVGMREHATHFVDAQLLQDQRAFMFAAQGSLLVDENIILDQFEQRLGASKAWDTPQFVYVNFQSAHFPYHHDAIPGRLTDTPVQRAEITQDNAHNVQLTYWNAIAHADAALGRLIAHLKATGAWQDTVLLVSGDHGEALFENGFLGHGHIIDRVQYGTFLVSNRPLDAVQAPISISDYRPIIHQLLGTQTSAFEPLAPFMHIGPLTMPTAIGMHDQDFGIVAFRFDKDEACFERPGQCIALADLTGKHKASVNALVARWGSERWAAQ